MNKGGDRFRDPNASFFMGPSSIIRPGCSGGAHWQLGFGALAKCVEHREKHLKGLSLVTSIKFKQHVAPAACTFFKSGLTAHIFMKIIPRRIKLFLDALPTACGFIASDMVPDQSNGQPTDIHPWPGFYEFDIGTEVFVARIHFF